FGHEFSKDIRFFSELELEHTLAGDGTIGKNGDNKPGEIELEQAYIEFDLNKTMRAKGGLFLVPVGIINETHEPNTFYGTERNPVEKNIIPATWWEAGAALSGEISKGLSYDLALTSGLDLSGNNNKIRDGRRKVASAPADSPMLTGRLKYTGVPGLELATTVASISDYTQGLGTKNAATMIEAHAVYNSGAFGLRALYASWDVDGKTTGYDEQSGWYIEPSYKISPKLGVFARYNKYDNQAGTGGPGNSEKTQSDIGMNYWPHEDVVIKVDYQTQDNANNQDQNGFNIGIGYQF
ncbi:MAG: OprO/OprP family phosphate-selective porin, partial [Gammaproteobacteria bacterium]|nr:OprO/OprP family phosphate-selective porin [Gammaproteobacteria bacterium]